MSASAPSPRKVATLEPSTSVRIVLPTVAMLMPMSAALRRSTTSSTSGLPGWYETSTSTSPGTCLSRSARSSAELVQRVRIADGLQRDLDRLAHDGCCRRQSCS